MDIKGFIENSLLEWEGRLVCVIFLPLCNLRCRYCHAGELLDPKNLETVPRRRVLDYVRRQGKWLDGAVITGGEPTLHGQQLLGLIGELRGAGLQVMLETNGTRPDWIERLISEEWLDAIAMDVKAPLTPQAYRKVTGRDVSIEEVRLSIRRILAAGIEHEFRITVVPGLVGEAELKLIAPELQGAQSVALQNFKPQLSLDPSLRSVDPYMPEEMDALAHIFSGCVGRVTVRGRQRGLSARSERLAGADPPARPC